MIRWVPVSSLSVDCGPLCSRFLSTRLVLESQQKHTTGHAPEGISRKVWLSWENPPWIWSGSFYGLGFSPWTKTRKQTEIQHSSLLLLASRCNTKTHLLLSYHDFTPTECCIPSRMVTWNKSSFLVFAVNFVTTMNRGTNKSAPSFLFFSDPRICFWEE